MASCSFYHLVLFRAPRGEPPHHRPKSRRGIGFSVGRRVRKIAISCLERVTGVEPVSQPWEGRIIPIYDTRTGQSVLQSELWKKNYWYAGYRAYAGIMRPSQG